MKSAERLFAVFEALSSSQETRIRDLEKLTKLNKTTIHRLLQSLVNLGYVSYNPEKQIYSLTFKIAKITQSLMSNFNIISLTKEHLVRLHNETMQTIHLTMLNNDSIVYLDKMESQTKGIKISSYIGKTEDLFSTASGKLFLAELSPEDFEKTWQELPLKAKTHYTITDKTKMIKELKKIKEQKYALDNKENEENVACIAAPIYDFNQKCIYTVSVTVPTSLEAKDTKAKLLSLLPYLLNCCNNISKKLTGGLR